MSIKKKQIRQTFRDAVFTRDGYKCKLCEVETDLDAHHITSRSVMPDGGYMLENGITLCATHHYLVETGKYSARELYDLIK